MLYLQTNFNSQKNINFYPILVWWNALYIYQSIPDTDNSTLCIATTTTSLMRHIIREISVNNKYQRLDYFQYI
jgi:hypothetical protein